MMMMMKKIKLIKIKILVYYPYLPKNLLKLADGYQSQDFIILTPELIQMGQKPTWYPLLIITTKAVLLMVNLN
jgi:hypothetical protein